MEFDETLKTENYEFTAEQVARAREIFNEIPNAPSDMKRDEFVYWLSLERGAACELLNEFEKIGSTLAIG